MGDTSAPRSLTTDKALAIVREITSDGAPVATVTDLAEAADVSRPTANNRLKELVEEDRIRRAKKGGSPVYWAPAGEEEHTDDSQNVEPVADGSISPTTSPGSVTQPEAGAVTERLTEFRKEIIGSLEELEGSVTRIASGQERSRREIFAEEFAKSDYRVNIDRLKSVSAIMWLGILASLLTRLVFSLPQTVEAAIGVVFLLAVLAYPVLLVKVQRTQPSVESNVEQ